ARKSIFICNQCVDLCGKAFEERPHDSLIRPGIPPGFLELLSELETVRRHSKVASDKPTEPAPGKESIVSQIATEFADLASVCRDAASRCEHIDQAHALRSVAFVLDA